jgi:multisubunit Na+/H+ antiporter MnhF subunit
MINVFKEFLNQEFGKTNYNRYFNAVKKSLEKKSYYARKKGSEELYQELFFSLKDEDDETLKKKLENLIDAMYMAVRINRHYWLVLLFYLVACLVLIGEQLDGRITVVSLLTISVCFLYKTWEFVVNKYCYVDANIILVYKSVLDQIIEARKSASR